MYAMEQFIQSSMLLIILTLVSVSVSEYPYLMILLCGMLMILFTLRSLTDRQGWLLLTVQMLISLVLVVFSGSAVSCLIFYEFRVYKAVQISLPPAIYMIIYIIFSGLTIPKILFCALLLFAAALAIFMVEQLIVRYIAANNQISHTVSVTAVNEMYEKKLNQELIMKNYLIDKNARLEERENISRNIHNSVGHSITAAILTLDAADMLFDSEPERAREKMNIANERIHTSLDSIRQAVRVLDTESELISFSDFVGEITAVIDSFVMDTMIKIRTDFPIDDSEWLIPHEHTEFLTGAVQELLTNGVRHGNADMFVVSLTADSGHIRLGVSDNGRSDFTSSNKEERIRNGFGLKKLISYAERCGGSAIFENKNGFKSEITLPLYKEGKHG